MENVILQIEEMAKIISNVIWPMFIPFLILMGVYISAQIMFNMRNLNDKSNKLSIKDVLPQTITALGSVIGTGTIIGFLGAMSRLSVTGQVYVESIAIWALIGALALVPVSYCETLVTKIVRLSPKEYICEFVSKLASKMYVLVLVLIYIFAIGGIQFFGIDAMVLSVLNNNTNIQPTEIQRMLYVIIPIVLIIAIIILRNKENKFIENITGIIIIAFIVYIIFFGRFIYETNEYIPMYIERLVTGFMNPVSMLFGVPLGLIFGMQRVVQIAKTGLGTLALASIKSNASERDAGIVSSILTIIITIISIIITSYIASYGMYTGTINLSNIEANQLVSYFDTVTDVTGNLGLMVLFSFIILSAIITLIGGYKLLKNITKTSKSIRNIMYLILITTGAILAISKIDMMFNILDILLIIAITLNIVALAIFAEFEWRKYKVDLDRSYSKETSKEVA